MRKTIFMIFATILASCAKNPENEELDERHGDEEMIEMTISIIGPKWGEPQTRGLEADGQELEDLWIFEKRDEGVSLVVHQSKNDLDFGSPKFKLQIGEKTLYIIASRGAQPTVDINEMTISWLKPKDTFWASHEIEVSNNTSHIAVTLQRVVAKMEVSLSDLIPENLATVMVHADEWRHGLFIMTGEPTSISEDDFDFAVPDAYAGTEGALTIFLYTFAGETAWSSSFAFTGIADDGSAINTRELSSVRFRRNMITTVRGYLLSGDMTSEISVDDTWSDSHDFDEEL